MKLLKLEISLARDTNKNQKNDSSPINGLETKITATYLPEQIDQ